MHVVIDSFVWVSELGLSSSAGSAVRYFLRQNHAVVAVPEVVSLEVARVLARNLLGARISNLRVEVRKRTALGVNVNRCPIPSQAVMVTALSGCQAPPYSEL